MSLVKKIVIMPARDYYHHTAKAAIQTLGQFVLYKHILTECRAEFPHPLKVRDESPTNK